MSATKNNYICKICGRTFKTKNGLGIHIKRSHLITSKEYTDYYIDYFAGICLFCGNDTTFAGGSYRDYCSNKCSVTKRARSKMSFFLKYTRNKQWLYRKIVHEHNTSYKIAEYLHVSQKTIMKICDKFSIKIPYKKRKVDVDYDTRKKFVEMYMSGSTLREISDVMGFSAPYWSRKVDEFGLIRRDGRSNFKNYFKFKEYIFESGRIEHVQGYEPQAIDMLLEIFNEDEIVVGDGVPVIDYIDGMKNRKYYPDIFIPSINTIIEVKSDFTYNVNLHQNKMKEKFAIKSGYEFHFMIL